MGKFLRRTSLDELPQFLNVLQGSHVTGRPSPRNSLRSGGLSRHGTGAGYWKSSLGLPGSWQVNGRSRVKFDEMVRLDLQYAKSWSPWMDIKILMRTPRAVIRGAARIESGHRLSSSLGHMSFSNPPAGPTFNRSNQPMCTLTSSLKAVKTS